MSLQLCGLLLVPEGDENLRIISVRLVSDGSKVAISLTLIDFVVLRVQAVQSVTVAHLLRTSSLSSIRAHI